jgi:hypothetical protein
LCKQKRKRNALHENKVKKEQMQNSATKENHSEFVNMHNVRVRPAIARKLEAMFHEWSKTLPAGVKASKTAFLRGIIEQAVEEA